MSNFNHRYGKAAPNWKGGEKLHRSTNKTYVFIYMPEHPEARGDGYIRKHRLIAENALGHYLPKGAVTHHHDRNGCNNGKNNIVICQDHAYHMILHRRMRAVEHGSAPHWRKCKYCKEYADPKDLYITPNSKTGYHRECYNKYNAPLR